ncbi:hypothetical protein [Psychrobacter urativorans]|uniref:YbjN domain-containing protein n=1 Tax=Psychrobacter urativorans TaxID=45610 RepID=A0A0M3V8M3_9GAMM|nr:hypothetical protein [Psychrobacter urativorans]ALF59433.1 hypothetical protein AOC03_04665 [Psychrobacter urativorans]
MSQSNKFSLWQKIKQLLIAAAPQSIVDSIKINSDLPQTAMRTDNSNCERHTDIDNQDQSIKEQSINTDAPDLLFSDDTQNDAGKRNAIESSDAGGSDAENNNIADTDSSFEETTIENGDAKNSDAKSIDSNSVDSASTGVENTGFKNNESETNDNTPIVDYLKQYFDNKEWHYTYYRPKSSDSQQSHHLSLRMRNKQIDCGYLFRVQENNSLLAVYGILPFLIPESHQSAAMLLITQINYDMLIGNLEMDINDGEIRYKNAIDVDSVGIDDHITEHLLQSVIAMTTVTYEIFSDLINTEEPAEDMPTLLDELRQQAEARTFFLPTQFVQ